MTRLIKWMMLLVAGFFVMSVLRMVIGAFRVGTTTNARVPVRRGDHVAPDVNVTPGGELKKCSACGVYNVAANSATIVRDGETVYYCSTACRAKSAAA